MRRILILSIALCLGLAPSARAEAPSCDRASLLASVRFPVKGWGTDFCKHAVPYDEIRSGGPPRDGIPPIDHPRFQTPALARAWLRGREPVIEVVRGGDARAYPLQILIWHEIVNDTVGKVPLVITFCPLCYTALVFERPTVDGRLLTFGTSGNLRHSDLVMWDRQTESWWQQFTGEAIVGRLTGRRLKQVAGNIVSFEDFARRHPSGLVLSRKTGFDRRYGKNPYVGYDDIDSRPFLFRGKLRGTHKPMARVVGVIRGASRRAFLLKKLRRARVLEAELGATPVVALWQEGQASAVDTATIAEGRDLGTTAVFEATLEGRRLHLRAEPGRGFIDRETRSTWSIAGLATAGPLKGKRLTPVPHHDTFWFAWAVFTGK